MTVTIVQKLKRKAVTSKQIKVKVTDADDNEVTEMLPTYQHGTDPLEDIFDVLMEALILERTYDLHDSKKTKFLCQCFGRTLNGRARRKFDEAISNSRIDTDNVNQNRTRFEMIIKKFLKSILPRNAAEDVRDYLETARRPGDMPAKDYVERLVYINECLEWYEDGAQVFTVSQLNKRVISKNLGGQISV